MSRELKPLSDLVPGWTDTDPSTGSALFQSDPDELSEPAREVRRHIADAFTAAERQPIPHPKAALEILSAGHLRPIRDKWTTYLLDRDRTVVRTAKGNALKVTVKVPKLDELPSLPDQGRYLVVFHGTPEVLAISGVVARLRNLQAVTRVADVLFWQQPNGKPTLYSLKAGRGVADGDAVDFPDPDILEEARGTDS